MGKFDALEAVKEAWEDKEISLGEKIRTISSEYSSNGLDLAATAAYIQATPSELSALLALGDLDDKDIDRISEINPPKTTWIMLANASEQELDSALAALKKDNGARPSERVKAMTEYVYSTMIDASGPTIEQRVGNISSDCIILARKKGIDFKLISDKEQGFLNSIASRKKRGNTLSAKQTKWLMDILNRLADNGAIVRNSIDGDQEFCDKILDALDR